MNDKRFYVYEWFNVDTGEVFYVGKGSKRRYKDIKNRNKYFLNYYSKHNCDVKKIKENLTEEEAFNLEIETIALYKNKGECKCNLTIGGEGVAFEEGSEEWYRKKFRLYDASFGAKNDEVPYWCLELEEAFERCSGYVSSGEISFDYMVEVWREYEDIKFGRKTFEEMLMSDPCFKDVWEGIC